MRLVRNGLGVLAALVFIAASAAMNWVFLAGHGKTPLEAHILGAVSVAADILKALLPFYIASAWMHRRLLHAGIGSVMFTLLLAFALFSALGFAAGNRGAVTGSREALNARHAAVTAELKEIDIRISKIKDSDDTGIIEAAIARHRQDPRWASSKACEDATITRSREYCAEFFRLRGELAAASSAKLLREQREALNRQRQRLEESGAGQEADPQAKMLAILAAKVVPDADASAMQIALAVWIAVMVEFGAAFGLFIATGHGPRRPAPAPQPAHRESPDRPPAPPLAPASPPTPLDVLEPVREPEARPSARRNGERPARRERPDRPPAREPAAAVPRLEGPERFRLHDAQALLATRD
jgi:hypothetical protein